MRPYSRNGEIMVVSIVLAAFIVFSEAIKIENVREVAKDANSVTVEWLVAASDASSSNDWIGYKIKYTRADASDARVMSILVSNLADKRVRIDSLRPFTDYKIQVSALNRQQEEGPASNMITIRTNEAVPGAPQDLKVNKLNRSAIEIEWKPPKPDELNGVIKGYRIQYSRVSESSSGGSGASDDVRTVKINDVQKMRYTLSELEPATTYRILVFAINSRGDGLRSSPLILTTHKDLPSRPDNIRTQIDKDELRISWSMENSSLPLLSGYRLYFNNEIYHLDANANEISLRRPKWENDKQYELRLAAKSRKYEDSYGEEAYYLISTRKEQGKLSLNADKVSQTSATLKWSITLSSKEAISHYKLEYYLKSQGNQILKIDQIAATKHDATLTNLRPNSVYIAQLVAIYSTPTQPPEEAITYFKTQSNDISPPRNLAIDRYEPDKVHIKWDKDESLLRIKSYRVYYSEISPDLPADATLIQLNPSLLWRQIDVNDVQNTELDIKVLDPRLTYAFKVVSIDHQGQESAESPVVLTPSKPTLDSTPKPTTKDPSPNQNQMVNFAINDQIGVPREVDIMEFTSTSVKFSWIPPKNLPNSDSSYSFRISYVDHRKTYKDAQGIERTHSTGTIFNLLVPGRDDPSLKIMWLVNNLLPDTKYEFNISAVLSSQQSQGPAVTKTIKTKRDRPEFVSRPSVQGIYAADNTVLLKLGGASEKNGPIGSYWLVVVPQHDPSFFDSSPDRDLAKLLRVSINERDHVYSNESSYIAAEFQSFSWQGEFLLGNGRQFGRFFNRPLIKGTDYKVYTIAFTEEGYQLHNSGPNMIGLGDVFSRVDPNSEDRSELASSPLAIGDLFSLSQYSEVFNTKPFESRAVVNLANDYQNILWITGAVAALIIVFIIIAGVSIHLMNKNRRKAPMSSTNHMLTTTNTATTSSSASPTTLLLNSNGTHQIATAMNTNTLSNGSKSIEATLSRKNPLGLLTTVTQSSSNAYQPIATSNPSPPQNNNQSYINENLYTSIDIAQRQFLLTNANANNNFNNNNNNSMNNNSYQIEASPLFAQSSFSNPQLDPIEMRRVQYSTAAMQSHPPIKVEELALYIDALKADANERFSEEYESIEPGQQFTWHASTLECNRAKNRYANVIAYDHSRVVLTNIDHHHQGSDYINANYLDGYRKRNAYIATQGPLPSTYGDFWRMIWEQRTSTIVMMTKLEERNRLKCDQYWPTRGTDVYDGIMQVSLVDLNELATYSIRTFVIANLKCPTEPKREIKHFQYTAWPDHGVPDHATPFLMFLRRVRAANPVDAGPLVVHCSAGVGRTGCFIVIDAMLERLKCEKSVDIYGYVTCLRSQRNYMVQTEDQYVFCYDAVLEAAQNGVTEVPANSLYVHLEQLLQSVDENCTLTEMELEYKRLSNIKAPQSKFQSANMPANKFKNRLVNILPYEATRVCLSLLSSGGSGVNSQSSPNQSFIEGSDYINANFIDGYRYKKAYIATQAPLSETIEDFWRMLWEHNSTIIVMLTKLREMGREKCAQYWPTERSIRYHYFVVDPIAEYNMSQYILREFKITDARDGQSRTIRQFQFVDWPEQGVPKSGESIIELIGQVHKTKEQFGQTGPITVHCSAGVGRTGVFLTLSIVLERMRYEGMIDVFNTVKMLRTQRPAMVQTEDQYQFCYRAALEYLGSFDNFDN